MGQGSEPGLLTGAVGQQHIGQLHHLRGGSVVPEQPYHRRLRMAAGEAQQEVRGGPGEGVDGLRGVADDAELLTSAHPEVQQALLQRGDVLVLVDYEVPILLAHLGGDPLIVLEHAHGQQQHVLEVDQVLVQLDVLVGLVELREGTVVHSPGLGPRGGELQVGLGGEGGDLRPFDFGGQVPQCRAVRGDVQPTRGLGEQPDLVIENLRHGPTDGDRPEELQLAQRCGVEGSGLDAGSSERVQPGAHLRGGTGGEGDRQQPVGIIDPGAHPVGDPVGDGPGLAGARAGQDAQRAAQCAGGLALLVVEPVEDRLRSLRV